MPVAATWTRLNTRLRTLLLLAARTDARASVGGGHWRTRCLHCRTTIGITVSGEPWPGTSLEHVVARSWFDQPKAAALIVMVGVADDARNLALACARCNHQKGRGPDANGPGDPHAYQIVASLLAARLARWRELLD